MPTRPDKAGPQRRGGWFIDTRVRYATLSVVAIVAVALVVVNLSDPPPGRVVLAELPDDPSVTVNFAGFFPPDGMAPLDNPLGAVFDGRRLYVAESDAGRIAIFDAQGGQYGVIGLPVAPGALAAYPVALAKVGRDRLAVVDTAAARVVVVRAREARSAEVVLVLGADGDAPVQPTAVAYDRDTYYVADGADRSIKLYDADGAYLRSVAAAVDTPLSFVGGIAPREGELVLTDSNLGRTLALREDEEELVLLEGAYALPRGVTAVDEGGFAVVDSYARAIRVVDSEGHTTHVIDDESVPEGPLAGPHGVAWEDKADRLYVIDAQTGRVMVYNVRL